MAARGRAPVVQRLVEASSKKVLMHRCLHSGNSCFWWDNGLWLHKVGQRVCGCLELSGPTTTTFFSDVIPLKGVIEAPHSIAGGTLWVKFVLGLHE